jgi:calcineurin-like phosphoesterase family protein
MNETIVQRWNSVVSSNDKVYHLGDVGFFNATQLNIMDRLNGDKILIKGNHDTLKPSQYLKFFRDIQASHVLAKIVLAHIPIHPDSLERWKGQVHGHVHTESLKDPRYYNVSVEVTDYTPVSFEVIRDYFNGRT